MPTSLTRSEMERLIYAFAYFKHCGLVADRKTVYDYFNFSDQEHKRWYNLWQSRFDMSSSKSTRDNFSIDISYGQPLGGSVIEKQVDRPFINKAIDEIALQENLRRENLFLGLGLKTSKDRLIILSKILEELFILENEKKPTTRLLGLINLCNLLAKDQNEVFNSNQNKNFKTLLQQIRNDLLISLGESIALNLKETYANTAEKSYQLADKIEGTLINKFAISLKSFSQAKENLSDNYEIEVDDQTEIIITKCSEVAKSVQLMVKALNNALELAKQTFSLASKSNSFSNFFHDINLYNFDKDQQNLWDSLSESLAKNGEKNWHKQVLDCLKEYSEYLYTALKALSECANLIDLLPSVKVAQSFKDRLEPIENVINSHLINGNLVDELESATWLDATNPKNPFFQAFKSDNVLEENRENQI